MNSIQDNINKANIFDNVDKSVLTLFNEPSLGLYYTQQHIQSAFPKLLSQMDNLYDNRKKISNMLLDIDKTIKDLKEITSLNQQFSFNMLAKINSLNFEVQGKKDIKK